MKIGIFGCGAVGCSIISELYPTSKDSLYILAKNERYARYVNGVWINGTCYPVKVTDQEVMDYIIVCLKNYQLMGALQDISAFVGPLTNILPLLNGITAHDVLQKYFPNNTVYYGVINVEANHTPDGVTASKIILLQYGKKQNPIVSKDLMALKKEFDKSELSHQIFPDMERRVWLKWMLNMGINQVSALMNATYLQMQHENLREVLKGCYLEVLQVAKAYHIDLHESDVEDILEESLNWKSNRVTSLTEDFRTHRPNELESFSGTLLKMAAEKRIDCPINQTIYHFLKFKSDKKA